MRNEPLFLIVDLFCGAGGVTTGFAQAQIEGNDIAKVIACINHDPKAIESHWKNHPEVKHFEEDIRTLDLTELVKTVNWWRERYPDAYLILWASLECTNFSKAKGGLPRDADSRTLAQSLYMQWDPEKRPAWHYRKDRKGVVKKACIDLPLGDYVPGDSYIQLLNPDYVQIENVVEFMSWGPLDDKGKPVSKNNGQDFVRWRGDVCGFGYSDDNGWKRLNSANFGAYTSRDRLFGCFARTGLPIIWPEPTHAKKPVEANMFTAPLKKWMPVKDVLNFQDEGISIFTRKKDLVEKTLERVYAGLVKYIAKGDKAFISKYFSGRPSGKVNSIEAPGPTITCRGAGNLVTAEPFICNHKGGHPESKNASTDGPVGALTTIPTQSIVTPVSLVKYNSMDKDGNYTPPGLEDPAPTIPCRNALYLLSAEFMVQRNNQGDPASRVIDVNGPARTLTTTGGNQELVQPCFLMQSNGGLPSAKVTSVNDPARVITTSDNKALVQPCFLQHYYSNGGGHSSTESPAPTVTGKARTSLVQGEFFLDKHFGSNAQNQSVNEPAGTVMPNDKHRLVEAVHFIADTQYSNGCQSTDDPLRTITADRHYHYMVTVQRGGQWVDMSKQKKERTVLYWLQHIFAEGEQLMIAVYDTDSEVMVKIKEFMAIFGLVDIKMRMLRIIELKKIQGFPPEYVLEGTQEDQKRFIGNSVVPHVVKCWCEAMGQTILLKLKAA